MFGRLLLLFLITPFVELALLIQVNRLIGFWPTMGIVIATGLAGSYLAKREGLSVWQRFNRRLSEGGLPGRELADGMIILIAGALLITPGVLTDVFGFVGLIPLTRAPIRRLLLRRLRRKVQEGTMHIQFGGFGMSPPSSEGPSSEGWPSSNADDAASEEAWHGTGRKMPRHTEEADGPNPANEDNNAPRDA